MKKHLLLVCAAVLTVGVSANAQTIAKWTFETSAFTSISNTGVGPLSSAIAPEVGTGSATGLHASPTSVWTSPSGNGSFKSMSANMWAVGDYFQFQTSTIGFSGIGLSYDQTGSNTGPGVFALQYSTDGVNFTQSGSTYAVVNGAWGNLTATNITSYSYDLSSITALNNANSVYFRVVDSSTTSVNGGTVATGGTGRIDNFTVTAVPEPSVYALLGISGLALCLRRYSFRK